MLEATSICNLQHVENKFAQLKVVLYFRFMKNNNTQNEIWVTTYCSPFYEVSNFGQLRSVSRVVPTKNGCTRILKSKILKPLFSKGYFFHHIRQEDGTIKDVKTHQLVYHSFYKTQPMKNMAVSHIDRNLLNNNLSNLEFITFSENTIKGKVHTNRKHGMPLYILKQKNSYRILKSINSKKTHFGAFPTLEAAIIERDKLIKNNWVV